MSTSPSNRPLLIFSCLACAVLGYALGNLEMTPEAPSPAVPEVARSDRDRGEAGADLVDEGRHALRQAWAGHDAQIREALDPSGTRSALRGRLDEALASADGAGLAALGQDLFLRDLSGWAAHARPPRRVHRGDEGGPDADRCASCHWKPVMGGGAGLVDMAFMDGDGETLESSLPRNAPALHGSAVIAALAAEMTRDLQGQASRAVAEAKTSGVSVEKSLSTHGVAFGRVVARQDGTVDRSGVEGISEDLVVRPFGWKGHFATLHEATLSALHLELGLAPSDLGESGVAALIAHMASLPAPTVIPPERSDQMARWERGQARFESAGCAHCHVPSMRLLDPMLALDSEGRVQVNVADLAGLERDPSGEGYRVWLYSDLKRHALGELLSEGRSHDQVAGDVFRTPPLWGIDGTSPYLHDGRALDEFAAAIFAHGGEARSARDAYRAMSDVDRAELRAFLRGFTRDPRMRVAGP